jgi:4-diphosphocytidyl-2-C-methyl-D-erythritol kinase
MRGVGEELSHPLDLPHLPALLVNPGATLATRDVFAGFAAEQGGKTPLADVPREHATLLECLSQYGNDLTEPAIACVPVIADVLSALSALPGARLVRMSGSGSTCFALFASAGEAAAAAQRLKTERKDWWVHSTTLGSMK